MALMATSRQGLIQRLRERHGAPALNECSHRNPVSAKEVFWGDVKMGDILHLGPRGHGEVNDISYDAHTGIWSISTDKGYLVFDENSTATVTVVVGKSRNPAPEVSWAAGGRGGVGLLENPAREIVWHPSFAGFHIVTDMGGKKQKERKLTKRLFQSLDSGSKSAVETAAERDSVITMGDTMVFPSQYAKKNPALMVISNPVAVKEKMPTKASADAVKAYKKFHMSDPGEVRAIKIPSGWPKNLICIGSVDRLDVTNKSGKKTIKKYTGDGVKVCMSVSQKELFIIANKSLGLKSGTALRIDYTVPKTSGRNKWSAKWWHPHDTKPTITVAKGGRSARIKGPKLKINKRGIIG